MPVGVTLGDYATECGLRHALNTFCGKQIGSGQTHKKEIITLYLKGYLVPTICQKTNHSKDAVERYIRDFEAIRLLNDKFDDINTISLITRLSKRVVNQYIDLIPNL